MYCNHDPKKVYTYIVGEEYVSEYSQEWNTLNEALDFVGDKHDINAPNYCPHCNAILVAYEGVKDGY